MKLALVLLLLAFPFSSLAQTLTIYDAETRFPLPLVTLESQSPRVFATTNAKGEVSLSKFKEAQKIEIRSLGFQTEVLSYNALEKLNFELFLTTVVVEMDEVVVSGTRWRQSTGNVPSKIVSLSPQEIRLQQPQTSADLLGVSGKVYIQKSQQGGGSPMIRGFATNRLLYTVDGVRMNTAIFRGGNIQNVINIDPFSTESVEVLFGPGTVIYGSDAIGGVMSFRTLTPQFSGTAKPIISGKGSSRTSSANLERTLHADLSIGRQRWAWVGSVSHWSYDHLRQGSYGPDDYLKPFYVARIDGRDSIITQANGRIQRPSAYDQTNLMQKVRFQPDSVWDITAAIHYSTTSPYGRYDRHNRIRNNLPRYGEWEYGPQSWLLNVLEANIRNSNRWFDDASIRLAYQQFKESRISRNLQAPSRDIREETVHAYSLNFDAIKLLTSNHTLYYGFEGILNKVHSLGIEEAIDSGARSAASSRYPDARWNSWAIYLNDELRISPNFTLQSGMRYNHYMLDADFTQNLDFFPLPFREATIADGSITGSIGAVYRPGAQWVISANLGTAFRSPNVDDIGKIFDSVPGTVIVPNPELSAEYAYNIDLGVAKIFYDVLKVDITGYYTLLDQALVRRDFSLGDQDSLLYDGVMSKVQALQNASVTNVRGIQFGVEMKLPAGFRISSDINVQEGEEDTEDGERSPSRHAPPLFGMSRLDYKHHRFTAQLYLHFQAERNHEDLALEERPKNEIYALDENGNTYAPAWYTLNVKGEYRVSRYFTLRAGIENITDQRYRPYSSGISGPGRNVMFSLEAAF